MRNALLHGMRRSSRICDLLPRLRRVPIGCYERPRGWILRAALRQSWRTPASARRPWNVRRAPLPAKNAARPAAGAARWRSRPRPIAAGAPLRWSPRP